MGSPSSSISNWQARAATSSCEEKFPIKVLRACIRPTVKALDVESPVPDGTSAVLVISSPDY